MDIEILYDYRYKQLNYLYKIQATICPKFFMYIFYSSSKKYEEYSVQLDGYTRINNL